jgi:hypothetical protein
MRARDGVPSLRAPRIFAFLRGAFAAAHKETFRIVHFSAQSDHVHLVAEGDGRGALIRGIHGLAVRCAKAINRAAGRRGSVWSHRYHARALRSPTETRHGLVYVLLNFRKHLRAAPGVDPRSSGSWFSGWRTPPPAPRDASPVVAPRTWLASIGWRLVGGALAFDECPGGGRAPPAARGS